MAMHPQNSYALQVMEHHPNASYTYLAPTFPPPPPFSVQYPYPSPQGLHYPTSSMAYAYMPPPAVSYGFLLPPPVPAPHGNIASHHVGEKLSAFVRGAAVGKLVHGAFVFVAGKVVSGDFNLETLVCCV